MRTLINAKWRHGYCRITKQFYNEDAYKSMEILVWLNIHYQPVILYYARLHDNIFLHTEYIRHIHSHMELTDIT